MRRPRLTLSTKGSKAIDMPRYLAKLTYSLEMPVEADDEEEALEMVRDTAREHLTFDDLSEIDGEALEDLTEDFELIS